MPFTKTLTEPSRTDLPFPKKQATASAAPIPQQRRAHGSSTAKSRHGRITSKSRSSPIALSPTETAARTLLAFKTTQHATFAYVCKASTHNEGA